MKCRIMTAWLLLACLTGTAAAAPRSTHGVRQQKLPNGLTLVLAPDARAGGVDVTVWYRAGTRWETAGKTGVTHMVEQLMFRSAPPGEDDYIRRVRRTGGSVGAESTPDYSSFYETVPPEAMETVFAMEADRMAELRLTPEKVEAVRSLVRQNDERTTQSPIVRGLQQLFADAFEGHPYAWPAIGRKADLGAITLDDCLAWHRERYGPGNAIVTVAGRFREADAIAAAKRTFGRVKARPVPHDDVAPPAAPPARRTVDTYAFAGPSVLLGWPVGGASSADVPAFELLARYLAGDSDAPLNRAVIGRDKPSAYVQCGLESRRDAGLVFALAALQAGADSAAVAGVESAMKEAVARIAREGVNEERLARVQKGAEVARLFSLQRSRDRAQALGRARLLGADADAALAVAPPHPPRAADLQAAAQRLASGRGPVVVWMLPAGAPAEGGAK